MATEFAWLDFEDVVEINKGVIARSHHPNEEHAIIDQGKLESALGRPQHRAHYEGLDDVVELAICYLVAIAQAHGFEQGNKRTGFVAMRAFLESHGYLIEASFDRTHFAALMVKVINRDAREETLAETLIHHIVPDDEDDVSLLDDADLDFECQQPTAEETSALHDMFEPRPVEPPLPLEAFRKKPQGEA